MKTEFSPPARSSVSALKKKHSLACLAALACIGAAARLSNINASLWFDEMMQVAAAASPWHDLLYAVADHFSPPLDYVSVKLAMLCLGREDWAVRLPALISGTAAIPLFYYFARSLGGPATALVAAALLALSPMAIGYAQEARMYSFFLFLSLASFTVALRLTEKSSFASSLLLGLLNGLLMITHYFGVFAIAGEMLFLLIAARAGGGKRRAELMAASLAVSVFLFLPWLPFFITQQGKFGGQEVGYALRADGNFFSVIFSRFSTDKISPDGWACVYGISFLAGVVRAGLTKNKKLLYAGCCLLAFLGGLFLLSFFKKIITPQNIIFLLPLYLLLCADGIAGICSKLKLNAPLALAATVAVFAWPVLHGSADPKLHKQPWKDVARYIGEHATGGEKIAIVDPLDRGCLAYYADPLASYSIMRPDWRLCANQDPWRIWIIDDAVLKKLKERQLACWVVSPSFVFHKTCNTHFFSQYRQELERLFGPPVQEFPTQGPALQLFYVEPAQK